MNPSINALEPTSSAASSCESQDASARPSVSFRRFVIPLILLAAYVLQGTWFIRTQSLTWDEPLHIMAGLDEWRHGRFKLISDHPPLGHLLITALAAKSDAQITLYSQPGVLRVDSITPGPEWLARRTRPVNLALGVLLGILLWFTARKVLSEGSANIALALYAFSPALIAHFSLATTDGVTTLTIFATAIQLMRWRRNPSRLQTALLGTVMGLLLLSKMHAPAFVLLTLGFVLLPRWADWRTFRTWRWQPALAAATVALAVLWGGYFFHVTHFSTDRGTLYSTFPPDEKPAPINISMERKLSLWVPAGEYVYGFLQTVLRSESGHAKYALGASTGGIVPWLIPLVIVLKWPPVVLVLLGCSIYLFATHRLKAPADWPILIAFPSLLMLMAMTSRIALGERHLMAAYPFVFLFASAPWEFVAGRGSSRSPSNGQPRRALVVLILAAVAANAIDVVRVAPDYLSYFNPLVSQEQSYRLLADSNLDWGQGLLALKNYEDQHPTEQIYLAYHGLVNPAIYGISSKPLIPNQPQSGTIVVSATSLAGFASGDPCGYCWVKQYPLKRILNHSLFVYEVP